MKDFYKRLLGQFSDAKTDEEFDDQLRRTMDRFDEIADILTKTRDERDARRRGRKDDEMFKTTRTVSYTSRGGARADVELKPDGSIKVSGDGNIQIDADGTIRVDGEAVDIGDAQTKASKADTFVLKVEGDIGSITTDKALTIYGNVKGDVKATSLNCDGIGGNVNASSVNCDDVSGDVTASTVNCDDVKGNVKANIVNR